MIVNNPYIKTEVSFITKRMVTQILNSTCANPKVRKNRLGKNVFVPCGDCEECLRKKRNSLVSRLKYQLNHKETAFAYFATYTYGDAQVYNSETHTWEECLSLPTLPVVTKEDLADGLFEYYKNGILCPKRVNVHDFKKNLVRGDLFGITYPRDLQLTIKKLRARFEDDFSKYELRIKVCWLNHYGLTEGKTHAPHFHVIYMVCCENEHSQRFLQSDPLLKSHIEDCFRDMALKAWVFCGRWYDYNKKRYVGKDIEPVTNGNVASYVSRYVSRDTENRLFPTSRIFPVRRQTSKGLGYQVIDEDSSFLQKYLLSVKENIPFVVKYNENGFDKYFSSYTKRKWLLKHYGLKMSEYQIFCRQVKPFKRVYLEALPNTFVYDKFDEMGLLKYDNHKPYYLVVDDDYIQHRRLSKYKNTLSAKTQNKIDWEACKDKKYQYDCECNPLFIELSDDILKRCADLYEFDINQSIISMQDDYGLSEMSDDEPLLTLSYIKDKELSRIEYVHHPIGKTILLHLEDNKRKCNEIKETCLRVENAHALKNGYIK